jgi:hypothetical protein
MLSLPIVLPDTLPRLSGRWLGAFRILWFVALVAVVIASVGSMFTLEADYQRDVRPFEQVGLRAEAKNGTILLTPFGSEARASGIVRGDRLVAVEGVTVGPEPGVLRRTADRLRGPDGAGVRIRTQNEAGSFEDHLLSRSERHRAEAQAGSGVAPDSERWIERALGVAPVPILIAASVLLFLRRPSDPVAAMLSFAFLAIGAAVGTPSWFFVWAGIEWIGMILNVAGALLLVVALLAFPQGRFAPRWTRWTLPLLVLFAPFSYLGSFGDWESVVWLSLLGIAVYSVAYRYRRLPLGAERQQIRWALFGFVLFVTFFGLAFALSIGLGLAEDPSERHRVWLWLGGQACFALALCSLALGLLVSLLRYRLYDADAAISRSAGYAVLTLLLAGTFGASAKAIEWFFETSFGQDAGALPGAIGAGLAVVLITPMHNRVHGWAERRFQKALLHLRRDLPDCVGDLRETAGMGELLDEVLARVEAGTRAVRSAVVIDGETVAARGDSEGDFPLSVPLRIGHQQTDIGTLLVGPRPDGSPVGKDEREALEEIADPIARAIRIVRERERREARADARALDNEARFAAIEAALAKLGGAAPRSAPC